MQFKDFIKRTYRRIRNLLDLSDYLDVDLAAVNIRDNVAFRGPNIIILFCAIVIASLGLNVNSIPVIIGAMLISPLMSPILGLGLGLGTNDTDLLGHALKHLAIMVSISIFASTLYFIASPLDMEHPTELLARTNPTIYDVLIALFGGFAGILEVSRKDKGTVMSGVAIATALMPPLCTVGYGLANFEWHYVLGALYLFSINGIFIALAAYIGTKVFGYQQVRLKDLKAHRRTKMLITIFLIILIVPSVISAIRMVRENRITQSINAFVSENKNIGRSYIFDYRTKKDTQPVAIELYIAGESLGADEYEQLYKSAESHGLTRSQLVFHQDATRAADQLSDRDIMQEILRSNDEKLQMANATIERLELESDSLKQTIANHSLPAQQIEDELKAQYPVIQSIKLATTNDNGIVLVLYSARHNAFSSNQLKTIENWTKVRLHSSEVIVIQK